MARKVSHAFFHDRTREIPAILEHGKMGIHEKDGPEKFMRVSYRDAMTNSVPSVPTRQDMEDRYQDAYQTELALPTVLPPHMVKTLHSVKMAAASPLHAKVAHVGLQVSDHLPRKAIHPVTLKTVDKKEAHLGGVVSLDPKHAAVMGHIENGMVAHDMEPVSDIYDEHEDLKVMQKHEYERLSLIDEMETNRGKYKEELKELQLYYEKLEKKYGGRAKLVAAAVEYERRYGRSSSRIHEGRARLAKRPTDTEPVKPNTRRVSTVGRPADFPVGTAHDDRQITPPKMTDTPHIPMPTKNMPVPRFRPASSVEAALMRNLARTETRLKAPAHPPPPVVAMHDARRREDVAHMVRAADGKTKYVR